MFPKAGSAVPAAAWPPGVLGCCLGAGGLAPLPLSRARHALPLGPWLPLLAPSLDVLGPANIPHYPGTQRPTHREPQGAGPGTSGAHVRGRLAGCPWAGVLRPDAEAQNPNLLASRRSPSSPRVSREPQSEERNREERGGKPRGLFRQLSALATSQGVPNHLLRPDSRASEPSFRSPPHRAPVPASEKVRGQGHHLRAALHGTTLRGRRGLTLPLGAVREARSAQ